MSRAGKAAALCALAFLASVSPAQGSQLYTFVHGPQGGWYLATIDPQTGEVSPVDRRTLVHGGPGVDFPLGEFTPYAGRYGWLKRFDIATGRGENVARIIMEDPADPPLDSLHGIAFSPPGRLFAVDVDTRALYEIIEINADDQVALTRCVGLLNIGEEIFHVGSAGIDFAPDGTLYLISGGTDGLYTVDMETAQVTPVGDSGGYVGFHFGACDLAITADGTIYASANVDEGQTYQGQALQAGPTLFTIDPLTAAATIVTRLRPQSGYKNVQENALGWGPTLCVEIDVSPGADPSPINLGSHGVVPVAIVSSEGFDATLVDEHTVTFAGAGVAVRGRADNVMAHEEDVNGDGLADLVIQVEVQNLDPDQLQTGTAILSGWTIDGMEFIGYDAIVIVPPEE